MSQGNGDGSTSTQSTRSRPLRHHLRGDRGSRQPEAEPGTIPYTAIEIAEEAKRAYDAGASVGAHPRAPRRRHRPAVRSKVFAKIKEIEKRCPVLLNFSTGTTILEDVSEQATTIGESRPHIAALNMGTMNYSKYPSAGSSSSSTWCSRTPTRRSSSCSRAMSEAGREARARSASTLGRRTASGRLLDMGHPRKPLQFSFIVNVLGGIPPLVESLQLQTKIMPPGSEWEVIGISKCGWRMIGAALALGGNMRAGLEDNLYLPNGEMAKSNGELIEVAARMCRDTGRKVATVEQAKQILGLEQFMPKTTRPSLTEPRVSGAV